MSLLLLYRPLAGDGPPEPPAPVGRPFGDLEYLHTQQQIQQLRVLADNDEFVVLLMAALDATTK